MRKKFNFIITGKKIIKLSEFVFFYSVLSGLLCGCGGGSDLQKQVNETKAMSLLKQYSTAQAIYQTETEGEYGTLKELHGGPGYIQDELYNAWDGNVNHKSVGGYLFSEITEADSGKQLKLSERAGLAAYPAEPGVSGDRIILMLLDMTESQEPPPGYEDGSVNSLGDDWNFYVANYGDIGKRVTRWPLERELESKWIKLEKHNPQEALKEAEQLTEKARR